MAWSHSSALGARVARVTSSSSPSWAAAGEPKTSRTAATARRDLLTCFTLAPSLLGPVRGRRRPSADGRHSHALTYLLLDQSPDVVDQLEERGCALDAQLAW